MKSERASLIIIQGAPGTGKSTLAHKLQKDLGIGLLSADDIKEFLFDQIGSGTRDWSNAIGKSFKPYSYELARISLEHKKSIIFESAFWSELARKDMTKLLEETRADAIEVFCFTSEEIRRQRFNNRIVNGTRHAGHANGVEDLGDTKTYEKLAVCDTLEVDTTDFNEEDYQVLRGQLATFLKEGSV